MFSISQTCLTLEDNTNENNKSLMNFLEYSLNESKIIYTSPVNIS